MPIKKAIILAGGKGTRLYPVTLETPKPLLTVNKKPIVNYLIEMFKRHGVEEVAITVRNADYDDFAWWLRRWQNDLGGVWVNLMKEEEPMGTFGYWAHTLHNWTGEESFFLTNGDELKDVDLTAMANHHHKVGGLATIAAVEVPNPQEYGVLICEGDHICNFLEKPKDPPANFISSGLYLIDPKVRMYINEKIQSGEKFLMIEKDLFPKLAAERKLAAYKSKGKWFDCGNLQRWEKAIKEWGSETK
jgi:NDP-sugar pyrophosphorylase family protein